MTFHFAPSELITCTSAFDNSLWVYENLQDDKPIAKLEFGRKGIVLSRGIWGIRRQRYLILFDDFLPARWVDAGFVVPRSMTI